MSGGASGWSRLAHTIVREDFSIGWVAWQSTTPLRLQLRRMPFSDGPAWAAAKLDSRPATLASADARTAVEDGMTKVSSFVARAAEKAGGT